MFFFLMIFFHKKKFSLLLLKECGFINHWRNREIHVAKIQYWQSQTTILCQNDDDNNRIQFISYTLKDFSIIFKLHWLGMILSIFMLIIEIFHQIQQQRSIIKCVCVCVCDV